MRVIGCGDSGGCGVVGGDGGVCVFGSGSRTSDLFLQDFAAYCMIGHIYLAMQGVDI